MDGYISKQVDTWYTIGEWFIGAILICYILYPFLLYFIKTSEAAVIITLISLFLIFLDWRMLNQNSFRNIFSCLISFVLGIIFVKYKLYSDQYLRYASGVLVMIFMFIGKTMVIIQLQMKEVKEIVCTYLILALMISHLRKWEMILS